MQAEAVVTSVTYDPIYQADRFVADRTSPVLEGISLDLHNHTLTLTFDETINHLTVSSTTE